MGEQYDVAVIGAGQGGLPAAHMAANLGARVVLIEAREVGGT
ncbi:MAG: FAD-dependent oxidoreductase [Chloroflexi bacterium]|nr:FAD-dependent oxidoreductase [Chloroflexota bacterium]